MKKSTRTTIFWVVLVAVLAYWIIPIFWKVHTLRMQRADLQEEIGRLSSENQRLENEIRLIKNDPIYLENIARKKFKKAKEGELVYRIVSPEPTNED